MPVRQSVIFTVAVILFVIYGLGWLCAGEPERRAYGLIALVTGVASYLAFPW
jgi:hypothetical protein